MLLKLLILSIFGLTFIGCFYNDKPTNLDNWTGRYDYEEEPIEANAGYYMVMEWTLAINKNNDTYQAVLEVNGQQTYIRLLTDIAGDSDEIAIIYNSLIDGSSQKLKKGDTLFTLSRTTDKIDTRWFALEPRLLESPPKECSCFMRTENSSR